MDRPRRSARPSHAPDSTAVKDEVKSESPVSRLRSGASSRQSTPTTRASSTATISSRKRSASPHGASTVNKISKRSKTWTNIEGSDLKYYEEVLEEFVGWMFSRHLLFLRRSADPAQTEPWIDNTYMTRLFSCCLYRELDYGTQFLIREVINDPKIQDDLEEQIFRVALYRVFNKPRTWTRLCEELGATPSYAAFSKSVLPFKDALTKIAKEQALGNGAYLMIAPGGEDALTKKLRVVRSVMDGTKTKSESTKSQARGCPGPLPKRLKEWSEGSLVPNSDETTVEMACNELEAYPMFGGFLAYQLILDLSYLPSLNFDFERDAWVSTGPGSRDGLDRIFKFNCSGSETISDQHLEGMRFIKSKLPFLWPIVAAKHSKFLKGAPLPDDCLPPTLPGMSKEVGLVEIEHALCEFDKYSRFTKANNKVKNKKLSGRAVTVDLPLKYAQTYPRKTPLA